MGSWRRTIQEIQCFSAARRLLLSYLTTRDEGFQSSSLPERLFKLSISTHQMIDQHAQTVVSSSRKHPYGLLQRPAFVGVPASSSLPAAWPCARASSRASSSRLFDAATFFRQDITFDVGRQVTDFWQGLTLDQRLASGGGGRIRANRQILKDLRGTA